MNLNDIPGARYEADFCAWLGCQIGLLREGHFTKLDLDNVCGELEGLLRSEHKELRHRLTVLLVHLLKCQFQAYRKGRSWRSTLEAQRTRIDIVLQGSPSLRPRLPAYAVDQYPAAVRQAAIETGLPETAFPAELPYTVEQLMDHRFIP